MIIIAIIVLGIDVVTSYPAWTDTYYGTDSKQKSDPSIDQLINDIKKNDTNDQWGKMANEAVEIIRKRRDDNHF